MTTVEEDRTQARIDGLLEALRDAEADFRRSYARVLHVVAELDAEKAGAVTGFGTTARLLAGVLNLSKGEAKARAEQAGLLTPRQALTGEVLPPTLPATAIELAAGAIGPAHVRVITATMRLIPASTHPGTVAEVEQTLATAARRFDPAALSRIGERLLAHLDPDGTAPADEPENTRKLRVRTGSDGTVSLTGHLDPEGGARVLEVLGSLNGCRAPVDGIPDTRTPARRDADALVEAMSRLLDDGELPTRGGQRPHLVLTMGLNDLIDGLGSALLDTGGCLSAAEARRLACDAAIIPMVLGSDSMPLDVGRQQRLATAALRDALGQRDKGCCFPGCNRRPRYCHAHHIASWLDGGETALCNMCLLCEHHHVIVHRQGWRIQLDARGRPEFTPPEAVDPTRTPLLDPLRQ
ncbi:MAG: HNH endonuclease [Actinomycetota bacterium]|nr:HNH endonuclease [Actinomycetota bacterium]